MTHGCLKIIGFDDPREIMLHTCHTGMDIPKAVMRAIEVLSRNCNYLTERNTTVKEFLKSFKSGIQNERLGYQPSAAALIIAACPCLLEPVQGFEEDLPKWSEIDNPYVLKVSEVWWELKDQEGKVIQEFDPTLELAKSLEEMTKLKKELENE